MQKQLPGRREKLIDNYLCFSQTVETSVFSQRCINHNQPPKTQ
jgi:hypothetical protein